MINACIRRKLEVTLIEDKMRENCLRQFGHVKHMPISGKIMRSDRMIVIGVTRIIGRPK